DLESGDVRAPAGHVAAPAVLTAPNNVGSFADRRPEATPDTWLDLGPSRAATSGLVRGTATRGPTAEQRTAARPRSSQVSQRPVDAAHPFRLDYIHYHSSRSG